MGLGTKSKLTDMRLSRADKLEERAESIAADMPDYPYGLSLSLDEDALDKLGISLPNVGEVFFVLASARVKSVSESQYSDSNKSQNVSLQIEQLALDKTEA